LAPHISGGGHSARRRELPTAVAAVDGRSGRAVVLGVAGGAVAAATVYGDPGPVMRDDGTWYTKIPSPPLWANVLAHIAVALIALGTALLLAAVGHAMYAWIGARKKVKT
jgi:hypothetical protein